MKKGLTEIVFILDRSGSMGGLESDTIGGFNSMIERQKKKYGWEFIFMGANIDAVEVAGRFGVAEDRAVTYECDNVGTTLNFNVMNKLVGAVRKCKSKDGMSACLDEGAFLDEIREDYEKRH